MLPQNLPRARGCRTLASLAKRKTREESGPLSRKEEGPDHRIPATTRAEKHSQGPRATWRGRFSSSVAKALSPHAYPTPFPGGAPRQERHPPPPAPAP